MTQQPGEYRHVGSFAQHGHDGMGWLGGVDIYVKAEDYDTHVNYSADAFAIYAENARLRHDWTALRERLQERFEMARTVLDEAGHERVAVLVPIEEVLIWMDEMAAESGSSGSSDV